MFGCSQVELILRLEIGGTELIKSNLC